jgi:hypothetical protein
MAQYGYEKAPDMPNVPLMRFGKTEADRQVLDILYSRGDYGRPFFLSAGVPADRAQALRKAFADTMQDPDFIADAKKVRLELDPVSGENLEKLTAKLFATPKNVVARTRSLLDASKQKQAK